MLLVSNKATNKEKMVRFSIHHLTQVEFFSIKARVDKKSTDG